MPRCTFTEWTFSPARSWRTFARRRNMEAPNVKRQDLPLTDIDEEDYLQLMEEDGSIKANLKLPEGDLGKEIRDAFDNDDGADIVLTVQQAMDEEAVVSWKFEK